MPLFAFSQSLGLTREQFLEMAELDARQLEDPDGLVSYSILPRVWAELVRRFPAEPLGLRYAAAFPISALGVVGYAITRAPDFGAAVELYLRFCRLLDPFITLRIDTADGRCRLMIDHEPSVERLGEPLEMMTAVMFRVARELNSTIEPPQEICFRHPQRHAMAHYTAFFEGISPRFSETYTGVCFTPATLSLPICTADPRLFTYLERYAAVLFEHHCQESRIAPLEERVRRSIEGALLEHVADPRTVARALGMSVRSLQRRLAAAGTSFSEQLDRVRQDRAMALLEQPQMSIAEIAFALGYGDPRAFYRSFRRWTGTTPSELRATRKPTRS